MANLWADLNERVTELVDKARFFDAGGYTITAGCLRDIIQGVLAQKSVSELGTLVDKAEAAWRGEYVAGNQLRGKRLSTTWAIVAFAAKSGVPAETVVELQKVIAVLTENSQNIPPIAEAFKPFPPGKVRFYGMCINYLMNAEGMFDQGVRTLLGLLMLAKGTPIPVDTLNEMDLKDVQEKLGGAGVLTEVLFDGWEQGHVRNSIAHCRFRYDETQAKPRMHFRDYNVKTKQTWEKYFTIEQFSELSLKLDDVCHIFIHILFLLRIAQLVLTQEVPRAGKDLIYK